MDESPLKWSLAEQRAWRWPVKQTPAAWAEANRVLPAQVTSEPGPWRNERTPYLVGVMDAVAEAGIEEVVFVKPTQVGFSEAMRNILGYWIDNDPGPTLLVMPDEKSAREAVEERIRPLLNHSPALAKHVSSRAWDNKQSVVHLDTMSVFIGWAGSPQSLASRPMRRVCFDEVDKYPPFAGREADPISLGTERTATYLHRRTILKGSTPTTRDGAIWRAWENCGDRRFYHVPCPHCGAFQRLVWQQVKWPKLPEPDKVRLADNIEQNRLAWYECGACKGRIDDRHKPKMLAKGRWESETGVVSKRVGFHLSALYSPWRTFGAIAAEFVRAAGDPGATMNFRNSWLAEPFENLVTRTRPSAIREKAELVTAGDNKLPKDVVALIATADTQKDHFYLRIRWWGYGYKSGGVYRTICQSFDDLYRVALQSQFPAESGAMMTPSHLLIDSGGSRTDEVYQFALRDPGRIVPCKGASTTMRRPWNMTTLPSGVVLRMIDSAFFKDMLARLISDPDPAKWLPEKDVDEDYCQQMASEHKIIDRKTSRMVWVPVTSGAANHWWDCEVLQCAAADMANLGVVNVPPPVRQTEVHSAPVASYGGAKRW